MCPGLTCPYQEVWPCDLEEELVCFLMAVLLGQVKGQESVIVFSVHVHPTFHHGWQCGNLHSNHAKERWELGSCKPYKLCVHSRAMKALASLQPVLLFIALHSNCCVCKTCVRLLDVHHWKLVLWNKRKRLMRCLRSGISSPTLRTEHFMLPWL